MNKKIVLFGLLGLGLAALADASSFIHYGATWRAGYA
jgi:hypothetical protein